MNDVEVLHWHEKNPRNGHCGGLFLTQGKISEPLG